MHGFGNPKHKALGVRNPLQARSFFIAEEANPQSQLIYVCLDLGYITHAMRQGIVARLQQELADFEDRKSTRLNSSHVAISYAVFCLKKKSTAVAYSYR